VSKKPIVPLESFFCNKGICFFISTCYSLLVLWNKNKTSLRFDSFHVSWVLILLEKKRRIMVGIFGDVWMECLSPNIDA